MLFTFLENNCKITMSAGEISEKITKNERLGELIYERNIEF